MATIVSVNAHHGALRRYEIGGSKARLTHVASIDEPCTFTATVVEDFRLMPDKRFAVEPPPRPTNPPAAAGRMALAA